MTMSVSLAHNWSADIVRRWNALFSTLDVCPLLAPSYSHAARHLDSAQPWLVSVADGASLVGYAALGLDDRGIVRCLQPYGDRITDYWDVVSAPSMRSEVLTAVVEALRARSACWDEISVRRTLFPDTVRALGRVGIEREGPPTIAPRLDLIMSFDFMLGDEEYKRAFGAVPIRSVGVRAVNPLAAVRPEAESSYIDIWSDATSCSATSVTKGMKPGSR